MNTNELYRKYGYTLGIRPPKTLTLGHSNIGALSVKELIVLCNARRRKGRPELLFYRNENLFRRAVAEVFKVLDLATLVWTDCSRLDHLRGGVNVAPALAIKEPTLFVFDNFQAVPTDRDRPLTFLQWKGGRGPEQLTGGSIMLLGARFETRSKRPIFSTSVMTRCSTHYLATYDGSRREKEYREKLKRAKLERFK